MRLGQISRKLNVKPNDIRDFIESEFNVSIDLDLNFKLEDNQIAALNEKFKSIEPIVTATEKNESSYTVDNAVQVEKENDEAQIVDEIEPVVVEVETETSGVIQNVERAEDDDRIESEKTNLVDPFEPLPVNPDAELIKAPKIKLEGLKVVGKIELPEKVVAKSAVEDSAENEESTNEMIDATTIDAEKKETTQKTEKIIDEVEEEYSIYKDKRGIYHFSQQQRENRKNSLARIAFKKLEKQKKKNKARHYQKNVNLAKKENQEKKKAKKDNAKSQKSSITKPVRKGIWGKFLNWLND